MSEPWAHCSMCSRWFYVEATDHQSSPSCPVCATPGSQPADHPAAQRV